MISCGSVPASFGRSYAVPVPKGRQAFSTASSITCVKWESAFSAFFNLTAGVRQGGILSPTLFGIYIDDAAKNVNACGSGYQFVFIQRWYSFVMPMTYC